VKISSGGKNPGQFTQTEVIPIIFYTFTTNILIFILMIQNKYIPLHWNSTRTPNNSTHKPATRLKTKKTHPAAQKPHAIQSISQENVIFAARKKTITQNRPTGKNEQNTKPTTPHTLKKAKQNEEAPHPFPPAACL
jgi:hypothetical protein